MRGSQWRLPGLLATLLVAMLSPSASAQPVEPRFSVPAGVRWTGGVGFGGRDANETTATGSDYRLFASESEFSSVIGLETGFGVRLTRLIHAEALVSYGQMDLRAHITSDVEGIPDTEASESIAQLTLEGAVRIQLPSWRLGRATPYVAAGGGYLRHLHEGRRLVENGSIFRVGGGIAVPLTPVSSSALRFDVLAVVRKNGAALDDTAQVSPSAAATFVWGF